MKPLSTDVALVLFLACALSITFAGHGSFVDENLIIQVTESIVERGELTVFDGFQALPGPDGHFYSRYGIGFPLLMVPFYLIGDILQFLFGNHRVFFRAPHFFALLCGNLLITVATGWLMYRCCIGYGAGRRLAVFLSLGLIFGTSFWPYSQTLFRLTAATAFLLIPVLMLLQQVTRPVGAWLCGMAAVAYGLNIREDLCIAYLLMGIYAISYGPLSHRIWRGSALWFGAMLGCLIWGLHNYVRFGVFFLENYADLDFTYPLILSIPELVVGLNRGLLVYSPAFLLLVLGCRAMMRTGHWKLWFLLVAIQVGYFWLYGKSNFWHGGICWGPRHMYFLLPFAFLPGVWWLQGAPLWKWIVTLAMFLWGASVNFVGVYVHTGKYMFFHSAPSFFRQWAQPIGHPDYITFDDLNLWWIRMIRQDETGLWLAVFILLLMGTILAGCQLVRSLRRSDLSSSSPSDTTTP